MPDVEPSSVPTSPSHDEDATGRAEAPARGFGEGTVLADRYRLVRLLGRGGMGSVWEAEHTSLGHSVAVKLIKRELADGERTRARFLREARSAANLRSPYVVQIFDYGVEGDTPYIAMERLEGESLAERLRRVGRLSPQQVMAVISQIARAVGKAHAAGIVHRDLKPDNVFITSDDDGERCKVLDFGIAKVISTGETMEANTQSGAVLGTPYYMSPEQATSSSEVDPRSDLWSLAVIAYECLVGERPFDGSTLPALAVKLLAEPIPVPSEHGEVPPGFDAWFARATQRDPAKRFESAQQLSVELADALGVETPSISLTAPVEPSASRPGVGWAVLLLIVVVGLGAWWMTRPDEAPVEPATATAPPADRANPHPPDAPVSPAATTPDVPAPAAVELRLEGPAGAEVYRGHTLLGVLPDPVALPRGAEPVTLRIVAPDFEDLEIRVVPDADRQTVLEMKKRRKATRPGRPEPSPTKSDVDDLEF